MTATTQPYTVIPDILEAIEVPPQGTLSRTIFQDERLKVVLFAFDTDQELSEHTAGTPAIIEVLRGSLALRLGGNEMEARPGAWVHMRAGLPHAIRALEPSVMLLSLLKGAAS